MSRASGTELTVVTFKTLGLPLSGSRLAERYAVTGAAATLLFVDSEPLPGGPGWVSDHIGLRARLLIGL